MNDFAICVDSERNLASLILGKVFCKIQHTDADKHELFRVIGIDTTQIDGYFSPAALFVPIELSEAAKRALVSALS